MLTKPSFFGALLLLSCSAFGCDKPATPVLPDPATAVTPQMIKAKNEVKVFLSEAEAYLDCETSTKHYNDMVDEMHTVAEKFNKIVKDYKKRMAG